MMNQPRTNLACSAPVLPANAPRVRLTTLANASAFVETSRPVTLIGSRRDCDLVITNSDISQLHCAVINTGGAVIAADLGTRSGTFVDGRRIMSTELHDGSRLRIASEWIGVRVQNGPSANNASPPTRDLFDPPLLRLSGADQQFFVPSAPTVIGRRHTCQIVVDTPDVSLAHALLFELAGRPVVFDLGSRSGTYLNNERVTLARVEAGDSLCIGGVDFQLTSDLNADVEAERRGESLASVQDMPASSTAERPEPENSAELAKREMEQAARVNRLMKMERDLDRREAELAKREAANAEAARRMKQFMEALGEAHQVVGFGDPRNVQDAPVQSRDDASGLANEGAESPPLVKNTPPPSDLPAPQVLDNLFPRIDGQ